MSEDIYMFSKSLSLNHIYKGAKISFQCRSLADTSLIRWSK